LDSRKWNSHGFIITGCQFGGTNTQIDINNILHPKITGCYFLNTLYMFNITTPNNGTISGNCYFANGTKSYGITISGDQGTGRLVITGNSFFGFNNLDEALSHPGINNMQ